MTYWITCPIEGCGKVYQDWSGIRTREEVERSFKAHLTGKHCLKGEEFQEAYKKALRHETK